MLNRFCSALLVALALSACSSDPVRSPGAAPPAVSTSAVDAQACAAQGGSVQPLGRLGRPTCVVAYADAGKTCRDKSDCSGRCLATGEVAAGAAATGMCQRDASENFGCRQWIENGVARGTICID